MSNYEVERKFLLKNLPKLKFDKIFYIEQYYLKDNDGYSDRVRKIEERDEKTLYLRTLKKRKTNRASEDIETEISEKEFRKFKKNYKSGIIKIRHIINNGGFKWEIDKFKNINLIMAEVEIITNSNNLDETINEINEVKLPNFIEDNLIMEVSDFKSFSNRSLSLSNKQWDTYLPYSL